MIKWKAIALAGAVLLAVSFPASGQEPEPEMPSGSIYEENFDSIVALMEEYEGRSNVSLMKLGKLAMTMGKTVGRAGSEWTRKVAKAFRRVNTVYMLEYGESSVRTRDEIEERITGKLPKEYLILSNGAGDQVFDETYGETSADGKHVSNLVIVMYGQSVICMKGTVLSTDVERIVRRLNKQL